MCGERAVSFVIDQGLNNVYVGTAAGVALLDLCHACSARLVDQFDSLATQCLLALKRPHRDAEVAINVLKGVVVIVQSADNYLTLSVLSSSSRRLSVIHVLDRQRPKHVQ